MDSKDISISMLIENDLKASINGRNNYNFIPLPLKNSINIEERKIYRWVKDDNVINCNKCNSEFTIINRKHHCRNCGKIFCYKCSNFFIDIPENIKTVPKEENYLDLKTYMEFFNISNKRERVCYKCYNKIFELKELNSIICYFDLLYLDINDYKKINYVCKSWNKVAKYYLTYFREIQYFLPDHKFTKKERNIINNNIYNFIGHSKLLLQVVLLTDWNNENSEKLNSILNLIKLKKKKKSCMELMCTRSCKEVFQGEDTIIILSKKYTYFPLIKYLIDILYSVSDDEISCYIFYIVNLLNFYKNYSKICSEIENFLLYKCTNNISISNQLFWTFTQCLSNPDSYNFFKKLRSKLVKILKKEDYVLFQNGYDLTTNLIQISNDSTNLEDSLKKYLKNYNFNNKFFCLPINYKKKFNSIEINKIRTIESKTKPIILPCNCNNKKIFNIMLKKEDIRKEEVIMKIIKLMDIIIKKEENVDLFITSYNILPISNEYGFIEFVPNSNTLYNIKEVLNFSIQNYILEKNPDLTINEFRDHISKSCAIYCVITYLLGIGDRHLDNIMITNEGKIFHIDFGYILGRDPKIISPEIRLTHDMIDAMGGVNSKYYENFKNYCGISYNCLRRHSSIFYVLLLSILQFSPEIVDFKHTKCSIKNHIIQKFIPGETYKDAFKQFNYTLYKNSNTFTGNIIDFFHKKYKNSSSSKSSSNSSNSIISVASGISNMVKNNFTKLF
jgi:hypothetical protein